MSEIIKGSDMSNFKTVGMTLCKAKNQNTDGVLSAFVVLLVKDTLKGCNKPVKHIMWEDDLFPGACHILAKYRMIDAQTGAPIQDTRGGFPIDMVALKKAMGEGQEAEGFADIMEHPGGMIETYPFRKGLCYANDREGKRVKNKAGEDVVRSEIPVFVQVKFFTVNADGELKAHYAPGMDLNYRGARLEDQFYRIAVNNSGTPAVTVSTSQQSAAQQAPEQPAQQSAEQQAAQNTADPF